MFLFFYYLYSYSNFESFTISRLSPIDDSSDDSSSISNKTSTNSFNNQQSSISFQNILSEIDQVDPMHSDDNTMSQVKIPLGKKTIWVINVKTAL